MALAISTDTDHRFELAIQLDDLEQALTIARSSPVAGSEAKWRSLGDRALAAWHIALAEECFRRANDLSALLLVYTSTGDRQGLATLAKLAEARGANNIAFAARLSLGEAEPCVDLLLATDRAPEAALFARTYAPRSVGKAVGQWRSSLEAAKRPKLAAALADPDEQPDEFVEGWSDALARADELAAAAPPAPSPSAVEPIPIANGHPAPAPALFNGARATGDDGGADSLIASTADLQLDTPEVRIHPPAPASGHVGDDEDTLLAAADGEEDLMA